MEWWCAEWCGWACARCRTKVAPTMVLCPLRTDFSAAGDQAEQEAVPKYGGVRRGGSGRIYTLQQVNGFSGEFPPQVSPNITVGEKLEYLSDFTRVVGGVVVRDRRPHTAKVQDFAGSHATVTKQCSAL